MVTLASDWQELRTPSSSHTQFLCMLQAAPATPALPSTASTDRKVSDAPPALQLPGSHAHPKSHIMMQSESQDCYYRMHSLHPDCTNISRAKGTDNESAHMEQTTFPEVCGDSLLQGSCHSVHSLPQHRPTWLAQQLFLSFPTQERPCWLPFRDREAHQDLQSQLNLHLPRFSSNRYLAHIFNSTHFNTNFSLEGFDRENPHPSLKQAYNPMGLDRSTLVESSIPVSSWCSFENSQEKNRKV